MITDNILKNSINDYNTITYEKGKHVFVFFPGWATDSRIFSKLDLGYNKKEGINLLDKDRKAVLVGWSLGGVIAAHFTAKYPNLVKKTVLISVKERYSSEEISKMTEYVKRDKEVYLTSFYKRSFSGSPESDKDWFDKELKASYLESMDAEGLVSELAFLRDNPLPIEKLKDIPEKLIFVHGEKDSVISVDESLALKKKLPGSEFFIIEEAGHVPFLNSRFREILKGIVW